MGWENRAGRQYYYRKKRINGRVVSDYVGAGGLAELDAALDQRKQQDRASEQAKWQAERNRALQLDQETNQVLDSVQDLLASTLLGSGYHKVKGEWRKKRHDRKKQ